MENIAKNERSVYMKLEYDSFTLAIEKIGVDCDSVLPKLIPN